MERIPPFESALVEAVCKVLGHTSGGFTGTEIGRFLQDMKIADVTPEITKWQRLYNALAAAQNKHNVGNHLLMFINRAMKPVNFTRERGVFERLRDELNVVLSFSGYAVAEDGQIVRSARETTLAGARTRANRLRNALEERKVHAEVLKYCKGELVENNYFHAVFEATKGVAERIRTETGLTSDGAELVAAAFGLSNRRVEINALRTDSEQSEQKGFSSLLIGLFGAVRNPLAHAPKTVWPMDEQDALDILTMVSFVHRKLDKAKFVK